MSKNPTKSEPVEAPVEEPKAVEEKPAVTSEDAIRELIAQNQALMERIGVLEQHKSVMDKVIQAPQHVHVGPKEPVTFKTSKGNVRTDY